MTDVKIIQGGVVKVGDNAPKLRLQLINDNGDPVNLSGFSGDLRMKKPYADSLKVDSAVTVTDNSRGIVEYDWGSSDTDTKGLYRAEVETTDGTDTISYPSDYNFRIHIMEKLA